MDSNTGRRLEESKWSTLIRELNQDLAKGATKKGATTKGGKITLIGSGIQSVGHLTLEAVGYMKSCDKLFYVVAEPVTAAYIKEMRPDAMDLYVLYDDDKNRYETYVQMAEVILNEARKGAHVGAVFYGHAGVFCMPPHRVLQIAKREGIPAKMLASPSAEDCLFADLEIDPSDVGCQSFEATTMLLKGRKLCTDFHTVLWQVGCVGKIDFRFKGFTNDKFHLLIRFLQDIYGRDYEIVHYIGAQHSGCKPAIETYKLSAFMEEDVSQRVNACSTFYIPPKASTAIDARMSTELGLEVWGRGRKPKDISTYDQAEQRALAALEDWQFPTNYSLPEPTNLTRKLIALAQNPEENRLLDLTEEEQEILETKDSGKITHALNPLALARSEAPVVVVAAVVVVVL